MNKPANLFGPESDDELEAERDRRPASCSPLVAALASKGVFKGFHGLEGLLECQDFWDQQPYGTRFYYGPGGLDYLHRDVLRAAVSILSENAAADRAAVGG